MSPVPAMVLTTSQNGIILHEGFNLPVFFAEEQARLLRLIKGKSIIVGRKTFFRLHTILPKCRTIVLSRDPDLLKEGAYRDHQGYGVWFVDNLNTAHLFASGLAQQHGQSEYFILGGMAIFQHSLNQATDSIKRLYLTRLHETIEHGSLAKPKDRPHLKLETLNLPEWQEYYSERNEGSTESSRPHHFQILNKPAP